MEGWPGAIWSKAKGKNPIFCGALGWLIFLWCSVSLHSAAPAPAPAPEGEKHPLNQKIGFTTENKTIVGVGKFVWEIQSFDHADNPARHVGISYGKKLHLPKLPHTDTVPALVIDKVQLSLTIKPPKGAKITSVSIKDAAKTKVTATTDYGKPFTTTDLSADATTLPQSGEIADAITVNIQHKKTGAEGTGTTSFQIPLVRVDTLSETLALCTKKIHEEGQHETTSKMIDIGSHTEGYKTLWGWDPDLGHHLFTPKPGETFQYFPQKGTPAAISCVGYGLYALRHGFQKWYGPKSLTEPTSILEIAPLTGMGGGSVIGYMQTLLKQGWSVYYVSVDSKAIAAQEGGQVLKQLTPRKPDLLDCGVAGSAGQTALNSLLSKPWVLLTWGGGIHIGMALTKNGTTQLYQAHYEEYGDKIYDCTTQTPFDFVLTRGFGFVAVPPEAIPTP